MGTKKLVLTEHCSVLFRLFTLSGAFRCSARITSAQKVILGGAEVRFSKVQFSVTYYHVLNMVTNVRVHSALVKHELFNSHL